jgi:outer membrane biosynthesis protein TonB
VDVPAALDELFATPREEFTALRDRLIKQARDEDADAVVRRLRELRKPTVAAWLANQVSRRHPDDVTRLAELGAALRDSHRTLDGDRLRTLSHERHELAETLTGHARRIAEDTGNAVSNAVADQLAETWTAAAAGADAAEQVRAGMLSATLTGGFDDWLLGTPPPRRGTPPPAREKPPAGERPKEKPKDEVAEKRRQRAEQRERQEQQKKQRQQDERERQRVTADAEVRTAERELADAEQARTDAEQAAERAAAAVVSLRDELTELRKRLDGAIEAERAARTVRTEARTAAATADRAVRAAERRQSQLD